MGQMRKPFQGIHNIVRFNWHFYAMSIAFVMFSLFYSPYLTVKYRFFVLDLCLLVIITTFASLLVSYYVYDLSNLYKLTWLDNFNLLQSGKMVNINAGFDETSVLLKEKFPNSELLVFDFYDPLRHTEVSIKRARKAYPPYPNTQTITTSNIPLPSQSVDTIFIILAAHEIRNDTERLYFFIELKRILKPTGQIVITEHLRDLPNFLAYNIGFLHFMSKPSWLKTFKDSDLKMVKELKITPFISGFLVKN
jgi:SAM-dependent methyltransferase